MGKSPPNIKNTKNLQLGQEKSKKNKKRDIDKTTAAVILKKRCGKSDNYLRYI